MKVHLHQIPDDSTLHLEGEDDASFLELEEIGARALTPVRYSLDVGTSEGGVFATGNVAVRIQMTCVKCLENFEQEVEIDGFALQKELDGRELVDLTPEIREDIHLALPAYPRCDAVNGRTCPASFPPAPVDLPDPKGAAAWGALDQLKTKD